MMVGSMRTVFGGAGITSAPDDAFVYFLQSVSHKSSF